MQPRIGTLDRFDPAQVLDARALDLTQRAFGLALELELAEPAVVTPRRAGRALDVVSVDRLLVTPTRPGAVLAEAQRRRIPIG